MKSVHPSPKRCLHVLLYSSQRSKDNQFTMTGKGSNLNLSSEEPPLTPRNTQHPYRHCGILEPNLKTHTHTHTRASVELGLFEDTSMAFWHYWRLKQTESCFKPRPGGADTRLFRWLFLFKQSWFLLRDTCVGPLRDYWWSLVMLELWKGSEVPQPVLPFIFFFHVQRVALRKCLQSAVSLSVWMVGV